MVLSQAERNARLELLRVSQGFASLDELLEAAIVDSVSPAICIDCSFTTEMEPDQDAGYCESCSGNRVVSALILAGII